MRQAIVVGSGAGGATVARELQGHFDVIVLEAGQEFKPFSVQLSVLEKMRKTGLFFDERQIQLLFPQMKIRKTHEKMVLVNGIGTGGTTTICTGNAVRMDADLKALGLYLDSEFAELEREIPISTRHQERWRPITRRLFDICAEMALSPQATPKMGNYEKCLRCGHCVLGCPNGAKWDSRQFLHQAVARGARLVTGCQVDSVVIEAGHATGVWAKKGWRRQFIPADLVILAAGGFATPVILQNSGLACQSSLFVDPVLCVAVEWQASKLYQEVPMPFIVQRPHFILSPYFDFLSFFFNKKWCAPAADILALMIKLADSNSGHISKNRIQKELDQSDRERLQAGVEICTEILMRLGAPKDAIFLGTLNAGHPGGMLPLTRAEAEGLHHSHLPENLYVADATLLPRSLGNPPILTIMALAKRLSKQCKTG